MLPPPAPWCVSAPATRDVRNNVVRTLQVVLVSPLNAAAESIATDLAYRAKGVGMMSVEKLGMHSLATLPKLLNQLQQLGIHVHCGLLVTDAPEGRCITVATPRHQDAFIKPARYWKPRTTAASQSNAYLVCFDDSQRHRDRPMLHNTRMVNSGGV